MQRSGFSTFCWYRSGRGSFSESAPVVCVCFLVGLALLKSPRPRPFPVALSFVNAIVCAGGIAVMTSYLGGFESIYFVGILVVLFVLGVFLPWSPATAIANGMAIMVVYTLINLAKFGPGDEMLAPLFFLAGGVAFGGLASHALEANHRTGPVAAGTAGKGEPGPASS